MSVENSWGRLRPLTHTPLHQLILEQLHELMMAGEVKPGDPLPAERSLAEILNVSRGTLREAFRILEHQGIIETRPGGGRRLRHLPSDGIFVSPAEHINSLRRAAAVDLMEARQALEERIVELACERATISDLEDIYKALNASEGHASEESDGDQAFHTAIAMATHNFVFVNMMRLHIDLVKGVRQMILTEERRRDMFAEHEAIYKAIEARDPVQAREAMVRHRLQVINLLKKRSY